jgi:Na+/H+-dicarboxylate symporter
MEKNDIKQVILLELLELYQLYSVNDSISGTASLDPKSNGKISAIAFTYIMLTNILGCVIAVALFYVIKPGNLKIHVISISVAKDIIMIKITLIINKTTA